VVDAPKHYVDECQLELAHIPDKNYNTQSMQAKMMSPSFYG